MKPLSFHILDWRITVGVTIIALLFNLTYFIVIDHSIIEAIKMSITSLFSIGATHVAHSNITKVN